jgi:hypothetical protein
MVSFTHTPDARIIRNFVFAKLFCCCCMTGYVATLCVFVLMIACVQTNAVDAVGQLIDFVRHDVVACRRQSDPEEVQHAAV